MKRNIISSKVEPQNTEDLWLNLVDGNIYSYEYGTWTNVNNVPNRVFNLDIDYTEENLTKFLSPLYEEGFSDDDFPKKVWDKFCETNPEFKLQGERENIRINVMFPKATITQEIEPLLDYNAGYQIFEGNFILNFSEDILGDICNWDFTLKLYKGNTLYYTIDGASGAYVHRTSSLSIEDHINNVSYYKNNGEISLNTFKDLKVQGEVWHVHIKCHYMKETDYDNLGFTILEVLAEKPAIKIASADIKLKQLSNESSFTFEDFPIYNSNYGAEYISGIVSNKLDKNKMWEYLGKDIKCLVPAKIDILLPYDISSDEFPSLLLPSYVESSLSNNSRELFMAAVASRYVEPENLTDEEILNSYRHYLNLESPFSFGVYQKDGYDNTPIQDITSAIDHPVKLNFEYENIAFTPEMIKEDFDQRHYDNNIETYYNVKLLYNNSINNRDYFSLDIYDLNIRINRYGVSDLNTNSILFSGNNDEEVLEYLKNNYGYNENVIYSKVCISHSYKDGALGLKTILYPIPGNLKSEETTYVKLATYGSNYSKYFAFTINLSELPMKNTKEGYGIGTNLENIVGEDLRLDLAKVDVVNGNLISNTTIPLGDSIFYNGTLYIPLTIFKKALNGIGIDFNKYYYTSLLDCNDDTTLHITGTSKDLKVNKLIEEDLVYHHMLTYGENDLNYNAWIDTYPRTYHIKTQAYYDLLKKFGYEITK